MPPTSIDAHREPNASQAEWIVELTRLAVTAPDVPAAVTPILEHLVARTAAAGSAYFQLGGAVFMARAGTGEMPSGPAMAAILAHGLPADTPLMAELRRTTGAPLFFPDTTASPVAAGFPELGVASLAAAPVCGADGQLIGAFLMHTFVQHAWTRGEAELFAAVAGVLASLAARLVAEEQAAAAREGALRALGLALEYRDRESAGHTDRVTHLAQATARTLGLTGPELDAVRWGAYLHDVGKIAVPDAILHKPGPLDPREWETMRAHAQTGHAFASRLGFLPSAALDLILHHHEKWVGGGYPGGRTGDDIPLAARIFAVCDVYDALVSERPYKKPWTHRAAIDEIRAQAGRHFDPAVVDAFVAAVDHPTADHVADAAD